MNIQKFERWSLWILRGGLVIALVMPSIVMLQSTVFPFITPKIFFFRSVVEFLIPFWVFVQLWDPSRRIPWKHPVVIFATLYLVAMIVSSIIGIDPHRSFWSTHERMTGLVTQAHFYLYFLMLASIFRGWHEWKWFLRSTLIASLFVFASGFLQKIFPDSLANQTANRISGTLGNPIYLSTYGIFHFFIALLLYIKEPKGGWRKFALVVGLISFFTVFLTETRGGVIAFFASGFVIILFLAFFSSSLQWKKWCRGAVLLMLFLPVGIYLARNTSWINHIPYVERFAHLSLSKGTGATRLIAWNIAIQSWKERPVFGWGPENFYYVFNTFYNPRSLEYGPYETWFDRPHNLFLEILSTTGIVGIICYLAMVIAFVSILIVRYRQHRLSLTAMIVPVGLITAYIVQSFFVFDHPASFLLFAVLLGFMVANTIPEAKKDIQGVQGTSCLYGSFLGTGICSLILLFFWNIQPFRANLADLEMQRLLRLDTPKGIALFKKLEQWQTPHKADIRLDFARYVGEVGGALGANAFQNPLFGELWDLAFATMKKSAVEYPKDVFSFLTLAQMYTIKIPFDRSLLAESNVVYEQARSLSPKRQQIYYNWAKTRFAGGDVDGAVALLKETINHDEKIAQGYWFLGIVLKEAGRVEEARKAIDAAVLLGYAPANKNEAIFLARFFVELGQYATSSRFYEQAIVMAPEDARYHAELAQVYAFLGEQQKSKREAERARSIDPNIFTAPAPSSTVN